MMPIIEVQQVGKVYRVRRGASTLLRHEGIPALFRRTHPETLTALKDVSFTVEPGEALGIIGSNGSGKSTLLKIISGITVPTSGHVFVRGRLASLLELGAGFHPLLTGRENVYLNARMLGMSRSQMDAAFDGIVEFSGIGDFIDNPVSTYSSGMYVRLAFSVAVHSDPDIFLVDEVLAVGDEEFQRKCRERIVELKTQGKTIVFVSHDLGIVNTLCDRVILLSKGEMVSRDTPQATIDFYLRQVGREEGIHTFQSGAVQVVFSNGRFSVFYEQREVSAPAGIFVNVQCMGQWHDSTSASWDVYERGAAHCKVRGRMSRLPIVFFWDFRIEDGAIVWSIAFECARDIVVDAMDADVQLPLAYDTWYYGESHGAFPDLVPGDLSTTLITPVDPFCREAAAVPNPESPLPPVHILLEAKQAYVQQYWANTAYVIGNRVLRVGARIPPGDLPLRAGRHDYVTLRFSPWKNRDAVREWNARMAAGKTLTCGKLAATLQNGTLRIAYAGEGLTTHTHFYTSILMQHLWNDSVNLQWSPPVRQGDALETVGESRRFPFRQHWRMELGEGGVAVTIWLEAIEPFDAQEYHASLVLKTAYNRWETDHESGEFPPIAPDQVDWRHLNHDYARGTHAVVLSSTLPSITLRITTNEIPFRMTAINTGHHIGARVLQALRVPEGERLHFEKGRHLYFSGLISAADVQRHIPRDAQ